MKNYEIRIQMDNGSKHNILCENTTLSDVYGKVVAASDGWIEYPKEEKVLYVNKEKISSFEIVDVVYEEQKKKETQKKNLETISKIQF